MNSDYSKSVSQFLAALTKARVEFVVVGGIALLQHIPGRNTDDLDLIVSLHDLVQIHGFTVVEERDLFAFGRYHDLRIDVLRIQHGLFQTIRKDFSTGMPYEVGVLPTATVDGLILLKLFALPSLYRQFDLDRVALYEADVLQLLARTHSDDPFFLATLRPHFEFESDLEQIHQILLDLRAKLKRFAKS